MESTPEPSRNQHSGYRVSINEAAYSFIDPVPGTRQILAAADFLPADDCVLVQAFEHGTRALGLDESIDLRQQGSKTFFAFRTDRVYRFTVDERGFDWGAEKIAESMLRKIARVAGDEVLILQLEDAADRELAPNEEVRLSDHGTEHLVVRKRLVVVFFKDDEYKIPRGVYTTEQLISLFPIEEGYLLNLVTDDGQLVTLVSGQKVHVKDGMHFYSQVPTGGSS
jgi:hypothetical protein